MKRRIGRTIVWWYHLHFPGGFKAVPEGGSEWDSAVIVCSVIGILFSALFTLDRTAYGMPWWIWFPLVWEVVLLVFLRVIPAAVVFLVESVEEALSPPRKQKPKRSLERLIDEEPETEDTFTEESENQEGEES